MDADEHGFSLPMAYPGRYALISDELYSQWLRRCAMAVTVAQMTKSELREMIEAIIEEKLLELLGDPDEGLPLRESVRERLLRQQMAVAVGERGEPLEEVVARLGLE